jgi:hypothetical protein
MGSTMRTAAAAAALATAAAVTVPAFGQKDTGADAAKRLQKAREIVQVLAERLRVDLTAAVKSVGPAAAIGICQTISPDLAATLAEETGVEIVRTSLKTRNPDNAPDEWEEKVLQMFQAKAASGADPAKLEHHEIITTAEGDKLLRYMKAIPVAEMCLACHGTDVKQDVKAEIARLYPEDRALGYKVGDLRGAFSLIHLIEE